MMKYCVTIFIQILHGNEVEISALQRHKSELATNLEKVHTQLEQEKNVCAHKYIMT